MKAKLTKTRISNLEPGDRNILVWDTDSPGLALVVTPKGAKSYTLTYRTDSGRQRRITIARHPDITPTEARKRAGELRAKISAGVDPLAKREEQRNAPTVADLAKRFLRSPPRKRRGGGPLAPRTLRDFQAHFERNIIPALGAKTPVTEVTKNEVRALHKDMTDRGAETQANRTLAYGQWAWTFARDELGWLPDSAANPWKRCNRNPESSNGTPLDARLDDDAPAGAVPELARLGTALAADDSPAARGLELLALTGCRPGEIITAKWSHLQGRLLRLPEAKTGPRAVFLGSATMAILDALPREAGNPYIIPSPQGGGYYDFSAAWKRARRAAKLETYTPKDLRHTFNSTAHGLGISDLHVRILAGHAPGTDAHSKYVHPERHQDLRRLLLKDADKVAGHLWAALRGELETGGKVVDFPARAGGAS